MTEHSVDLRDPRTGEKVATMVCADDDNRPISFDVELDVDHLRAALHACLDVYENDTKLECKLWYKESPVFSKGGRGRLWLNLRELGSIRLSVKNRSPGDTPLQNICVAIEAV
jgi:hypothetical protein